MHGAGELQLAAIQEFMTVKAAISVQLRLQLPDLCSTLSRLVLCRLCETSASMHA